MIHVCFSLRDETGLFSKFAGTAMLSLFENTKTPPPSITVHILHDNTLTKGLQDKLASIATRYGQLVKFYNVEVSCADKIAKIIELFPKAVRTRFTVAMYYRFFIPQFLSPDIDKIIYLDADVVVNLDIEELWRVELGDKPIGVIPIASQRLSASENTEGFFNSGVLLLNVPVFRNEEENLMHSIGHMFEMTGKNPSDQNVLNYCFGKRALILPAKFNRLVKWCRWQNVTRISDNIYHFNGGNSMSSFGIDVNDPFNRLWINYFIRTPFFDSDSIGRLYTDFRQIRDSLKGKTLRLSAAMAGKTRAFFVEPKELRKMKKIFSIRDDEEIILAEDKNSVKVLIETMKKSHGKKIFFVTTQKFFEETFPFEELTAAGFVDGKDFLKAWGLLSEKYGEPFNSYSLIKVL